MSIFPHHNLHLAEQILARARAIDILVATAESCTGGLIAALLTEIPGSSDVFECGFVTYSNRAKSAVLGVPAELIAEWGAVSEPVARRMAEGAVEHSAAQAAVTAAEAEGPLTGRSFAGSGGDLSMVRLVLTRN